MAIYVDNARMPYGRMKMSHLFADTSAELEAMATSLGLARYLQHFGTPKEHLDVSLTKRAEALTKGAAMGTGRDLVRIMRRKRRVYGKAWVNCGLQTETQCSPVCFRA